MQPLTDVEHSAEQLKNQAAGQQTDNRIQKQVYSRVKRRVQKWKSSIRTKAEDRNDKTGADKQRIRYDAKETPPKRGRVYGTVLDVSTDST